MPKSSGNSVSDLRSIARAMKLYASHFPGAVARPERPLARGACIALMLAADGEFRLRIGRYGRPPTAPRELAAWERECMVFREAFGVPCDAAVRRDVVSGFYYVIVRWGDDTTCKWASV